jgi:hypothetical protein
LLPSKKSPKGKVIELTDVGKLWGENLFVIYRIYTFCLDKLLQTHK